MITGILRLPGPICNSGPSRGRRTIRGVHVPVALIAGLAVAPAAAHGVAVTVPSYPLICGGTTGTLQVLFPRDARLPRTIPARAVRVNGVPATTVRVSPRTVAIVLRPHGMTCYSIRIGPLRIRFGPAARIRLAGRQSAPATVWHAGQRFDAQLTIVA